MTRENMIEICAREICALYCPHELKDQGATESELYAETVRMLETDTVALLAWLSEF